MLVFAVAVLGFGGGCTHLPVADRGLVAKPNVAIERNLVFDRSSRLLGQTEPGAAGVDGTGGGCVSCK